MSETVLERMPVLSLAETDLQAFAQAIGQSFRQFGFAMVKDHGMDPALVRRGWELSAEFFR